MTSESNGAAGRPRLLDEFSPVTVQQWQDEVERLLKGASFAKRMFTQLDEGITVRPLYTPADAAAAASATSCAVDDDELPGRLPFTRGARPLGHRQAPWLVAQATHGRTLDEFNTRLRNDLQRGQTAVNLSLDVATQHGRDPDQPPADGVGDGGLSLVCLDELDAALAGVDLEQVPVLAETGGAALAFAAQLIALLRRRGLDPRQLRGSVGNDPVAGLAALGALPTTAGRLYHEMAWLTRWAERNAPRLRTVAAYSYPYSDAGANAATELACVLGAAVQHLRELETRGVAVEQAAAHLRFDITVGGDFFLEIAKLRALRRLWSEVLGACGQTEPAQARIFQSMLVHARTGRRNKTLFDRHVNILRATTEAMAAVLGGCDSLHIDPFDGIGGRPGELSRRLARNTQLILQRECRFDNVVDPAGGSWYVESLTRELAAKAWELFQQIEAAGGMLQALQDGMPQRLIADSAAARRDALHTRRDVLVGTNQYPDVAEPLPEPIDEDLAGLRAERAAAVRGFRAQREPAVQASITDGLGRIYQDELAQRFDAIVDVVQLGATVGELTGAGWADTVDCRGGKQPGVTPLPSRRTAEAIEHLRFSVGRHGEHAGAACRVFCCNLGDVARYLPRLDFARAFFELGGFQVVADESFGSAADAAEAARRDGAHTVAVVGRDETYAQFAVDLVRLLKRDADPPTVLIAGQPEALVAALREAGADEFIHLRSDVHAVLTTLAGSKGVTL